MELVNRARKRPTCVGVSRAREHFEDSKQKMSRGHGADGDGAWSLYHEAETELALHVYPSHLADVTRAMADRLSRLLMR